MIKTISTERLKRVSLAISNMYKIFTRLLFLSLITLNALGAQAVDDSELPQLTGAQIALQVCSSCHGKTGQSISNVYPNLAGQDQAYLRSQLQQFKQHIRKSPKSAAFMWIIGGDLTVAQIDEISQYFANQAPMQGASTDSYLWTRGQNVYKNGLKEYGVPACRLCHQDGAVGSGEIPRLAGQHADYLYQQLQIFSKTKFRPSGRAMMSVTHDMPDLEMRAVSDYLGSLNSQ